MDTTHEFEMIMKLRQRLLRLIKLGEPNQVPPMKQITMQDTTTVVKTSPDLTAKVEECVRCLFNTTYTVDIFIQHVQQILNVTIKSNLRLFLNETIPLTHRYLQQHHHDPLSWDTFKTISLQLNNATSSTNTSVNTTRLPSLQQACFRLPPSCQQLIDLTTSLQTRSLQDQVHIIPTIRPDANMYQQKLIQRFAQHNFYLNECAEHLFLQTLYSFLKDIIQRVQYYSQHRVDTQLLHSTEYQMTSNVREQMRFLMELNRLHHGETHSSLLQRKPELLNIDDESHRRVVRPSIIEQIRQKEADETACFVLRESRLKRQKLSEKNQKSTPTRLIRASLQELIVVMENEPILKRSKTLLFAYANR